ncbi:MAG: hypothetical protein ACPLXC_03255 [Candidatus Pacearchaeota archaeon]
MDISNKFLVVLLVIAIVISIFGAWYSIDSINKFVSITGFQTSGNVTVNITERVEINVTQPDCAFGSGYVTAPAPFAELYPGTVGMGIPGPYCDDGDDTRANWTNTTTYNPNCMEVRNDGNRNLRVSVSSGKDASEFIGGTSPEYKVWSENKEASSCSSVGSVPLINFSAKVDQNKSNITICSCVLPDNDDDEIYVGCYLKVPDNAYGYKSDTWTFTATTSSDSDCNKGMN